METTKRKLIASIPSVDELLRKQKGAKLQFKFGRKVVLSQLRVLISDIKNEIKEGNLSSISREDIYRRLEQFCTDSAPKIKEVINLTGIVVHSNLGRSLYPSEAIKAGIMVMENFTDLEFDLSSGKRSERERFLVHSVKELTGAEDATIVNNNAAAVFLILNTFCMGKEVVISRGELVEIGAEFRIPDIMKNAGAKLKEIGTTNRTHLSDFSSAICSQTGLIMKVYTSNYEIIGFTSCVDEKKISQLAKKNKVPFVVDIGSGNLTDMTNINLPKEDIISDVLRKGVDLVTFSGDKLLGGPQCGIIVGKTSYIQRIRENPVKRAMRVDKVTVATLSEVLRIYMNQQETVREKKEIKSERERGKVRDKQK